MKLIFVHLVLITAAIGLAAIFAARSLVLFARGGGALELGLGIGSAVVGGALALYLRTVRAKWRAERDADPPRP